MGISVLLACSADWIGRAGAATVSAPAIVTPPAGLVAATGQSVHLTVSASGVPPLSYQWFKEGRRLQGATSSALVITNPVVADSGLYYVAITNVEGLCLSVPAAVQVGSPRLLAWGANGNGQLGNGNTNNQAIPQVLNDAALTGAAGSGSSLYAGADGALWGIGLNTSGQLGDGTMSSRVVPELTGAGDVVMAAAGEAHSLFLKKDGTLWSTGNNNYGQLGDGTTIERFSPEQIASNVVAVAAGGSHSVFLKEDGTVWTAGDNQMGQLGDGTVNSRSVPELIASNVVAIAAGFSHTLYIDSEGNLWGAGDNAYGELGDGTTTQRNSPVVLAGGVAAVTAGDGHSLYLLENGSLWAMGLNNHGQLGDGTTTDRTNAVSPASHVVALAAGQLHSVYAKDDGSVWAMGDNQYGQLGDGTTTDRHSPVKVTGQPMAAEIISGSAALHTLVVGQPTPPEITSDPVGQTVMAGSTVDFSVAAESLTPATYQWYLDGQALAGATAASYTVINAASNNAGGYAVVVTNDYGGATSAIAQLTVLYAPSIACQPAGQTVTVGGVMELSVAAAGSAPFTYQWIKDGKMLPWATNSTLALPNAAVVDSGAYSVAIQNARGFVISRPVDVTVGSPELMTWGANGQGQLGEALNYRYMSAPQPVAGGVTVAGANGGYFATVDPKFTTIAGAEAKPSATDGAVAQGRLAKSDYVSVTYMQDASHSLFVKSDGTLWTMGNNTDGQLGDGTTTSRNEPEPITTNVVMVAPGAFHSLFVKGDSTLWGMGANSLGQLGDGGTTSPSVPVFLATNVVAAVGGYQHSLLLKEDGTLWSTGNNDSGQLGDGTTTQRNTPVKVEGATNVVAMAAGYQHSLFLKRDGTLWAVGWNGNGQLGDGTTTQRKTPVPVEGGTNVMAIAAGGWHTLFLKRDGTLWAVGSNDHGQLGDGTTTSRSTPELVASNVTAVTAGAYHTVFARSDGTLFGMGGNEYGQVGDASVTDRHSPVILSAVTSTTFASGCAAYHTAAVGLGINIVGQPASQKVTAGDMASFSVSYNLMESHLAYQWYFNGSPISGATGECLILTNVTPEMAGEYTLLITDTLEGGPCAVFTAPATLEVSLLPFNITKQPASQTPVGADVSLSVSVPSEAPLAYQWFKNGAIVSGGTASKLSLPDAKLTDSGIYYVSVASSNGVSISYPAVVAIGAPQLTGWGDDSSGDLGDGTNVIRSTPGAVNGNVLWATAGGSHSLMLKDDGSVWAVGDNGDGQLGDGTMVPRFNPVAVATNAVWVTAGNEHSLFLKEDGSLWAMGQNNSGQLGDGTTINRTNATKVATNVVAAAAGKSFTLYLKTDGTLWAMGANASGQLGDGTLITRSNAVLVTSRVVAVAAGQDQSLFLKDDGVLWGMGDNSWGQLGQGGISDISSPVAVASNVVAFAAGGSHSLFLKSDGVLWGMGNNNQGQLGPANIQQRFPIALASNVVEVTAGALHSLYITSDGTFWAMGDNTFGELGDGTTVDRTSAVRVHGMLQGDVISGGCATHTFAIGMPPVPAIIRQPVSQTLNAGSTVNLSVSPSFTYGLSYQWLFNSEPINGATDEGYNFGNAAQGASGSYQVVVTNIAGSVTSGTAEITILATPPAIVEQPTNQTSLAGHFAGFTVAAAGLQPMGYQWYFGGSPIGGAMGTAYSIAEVTPADAGEYYVVISNAYGYATSQVAVLTVPDSPPFLMTQPIGQIVEDGATLNLTVGATGTGRLSYQWWKDGRRLLGATNQDFSIAGAKVTDSGLYSVVVSNAMGLAISVPVAVSVGSPQLLGWGDNYGGNLGGNSSDKHSPVFITTNAVCAAAGGGIYQDPDDNFDNSHSIYVDANGAVWDVSASGPVSDWPGVSNVIAVAGGFQHTLYLKSDGTLWASGQNPAGELGDGTTTTRTSPVRVIGGTNVVAIAAGMEWSMCVKGDGTLWAFGRNDYGMLGDGTTTARHSPVAVKGGTNVVAIAAGTFHSMFLKSDGTVWAAGDNASGDLGDGTSSQRNTPVAVKNATNVVAIAAGDRHSLFLRADGTLFSVGSNQYGQLGNGSGGEWQSELTPVVVPGVANVVAVAAGYGHSLFIRSDGTLWGMGWNGNGQLGDGTTTDRHTPEYLQSTPLGNIISGCYAEFSLAIGSVLAITEQPVSQNVVEKNPATFRVMAAGLGSLDFQWYFNGTAISGAQGPDYTVQIVDSHSVGDYSVVVHNNVSSVTSSVAVLTMFWPTNVPEPVIVGQPANQSGSAGQAATFTVAAGGLEPLDYQWYFGGNPISGATASQYTIAELIPSDAGDYHVVITNAYGSATSAVAVLTMPPFLLAQPASQTIQDGGTVNLTVRAAGTALVSYQWLKSGRLLAGATNANLSIPNAQVTDSGIYSVVVTNAMGFLISPPVIVAVGTPKLLGWGGNQAGNLGLGTTRDQPVPVVVTSNVVTAAAGGGCYLAPGLPNGVLGYDAAHSLYVTVDGTLMAMGDNAYGQLGDGTTTQRESAVIVENGSNVVAVAAGNVHSLFAKGDGTLWAMGQNTYGQLGNGRSGPQEATPVAVLGGTNVVAVAVGFDSSLFLKGDGTLWGMGGNGFGQLGDGTGTERNTPVAVKGGTNVVAVAMGNYFSLFLKGDGTLWAMGANDFGQLGDGTTTQRNTPVRVHGGTNVVAFAAGSCFSMFLKDDGTLWAMGWNDYGQLGDGTASQRNSPVRVLGGTNVVAMAAGYAHSLYFRDDHALSAVGWNYFGQLGDATTTDRQSPEGIAPMRLSDIISGNFSEFTLAIGSPLVITTQPVSQTVTQGQTVTFTVATEGLPALAFQWYFNGTLLDSPTGATLTLTNVSPAEAGSYSVVAWCSADSATSKPAVLSVLSSPSITASPTNQILAEGGTVDLTVAVEGSAPPSYQWFKDGGAVPGATNSSLHVADAGVSNSGVYYVVVTNPYGMSISLPAKVMVGEPQLLVSGNNQYGQLGDGTVNSRCLFASVFTNVVAAAAGEDHSLFVQANGELWAMGFNGDGELGNGNEAEQNRPVAVATNVVSAAAGAWHSLYVAGDGTLWAMGQNNCGQLGDGSLISRSTPEPVASNVVAAAAGFNNSLYVKRDGTLWAMGLNSWGQLGDGTTFNRSNAVCVASNVVTVAAGYGHSLFLKTDGSLWAMGQNNAGQLGDGTTTWRLSPVPVASGVTAIAAGANHSLFLRENGGLWAMGQNNYGQLGDGTTMNRSNAVLVTTQAVAVTAGSGHSVYVDHNGTLWAMGENDAGQLGDGSYHQAAGPVAVPGRTLAVIVSGSNAKHTLATGVTQPPSIVTQPVSQAVPIGGYVAFEVVAAGVPSFEYQWYFNGNTIAGATATNFTIAGITAGRAGSYTVVVRNSAGSITSGVAVLTIELLPSEVQLLSSSNPSGFRDHVQLTVQVSPRDASGTIRFLSDGVAFDTEPLSSGAATSHAPNTLARGTHLITAEYSGDQQYLPSTNSLEQVVTNHPPIAAAATYTLASVPGYKILVSDLATNWSDADGDTVTLSSVNASTNGGSVSIGGKYIFYTDTNQVTDQFTYVIEDGHGGAGTGVVNLVCFPGPINTNRTANITGLRQNVDGSVTVNFAGVPGYTYWVEGATNVAAPQWVVLSTNVAGTNGLWNYTDSNAVLYPFRLYRTYKP